MICPSSWQSERVGGGGGGLAEFCGTWTTLGHDFNAPAPCSLIEAMASIQVWLICNFSLVKLRLLFEWGLSGIQNTLMKSLTTQTWCYFYANKQTTYMYRKKKPKTEFYSPFIYLLRTLQNFQTLVKLWHMEKFFSLFFFWVSSVELTAKTSFISGQISPPYFCCNHLFSFPTQLNNDPPPLHPPKKNPIHNQEWIKTFSYVLLIQGKTSLLGHKRRLQSMEKLPA